MKRNYEVSYTVTYRIIVAANSAAEAEQKASEAEFWDWNDEDAKKILFNCRKAMQPGHRLLVADFLHSEEAISTLVPFMDFAGMMIYSGREREPEYLARLFKEPGFKLNRTFELPGRQAVFEAIAI